MSRAKLVLLLAIVAIAGGATVFALSKPPERSATMSIEQSSVAKRESFKQMTPLCLAGMDCPANAAAGDKK